MFIYIYIYVYAYYIKGTGGRLPGGGAQPRSPEQAADSLSSVGIINICISSSSSSSMNSVISCSIVSIIINRNIIIVIHCGCLF